MALGRGEGRKCVPVIVGGAFAAMNLWKDEDCSSFSRAIRRCSEI